MVYFHSDMQSHLVRSRVCPSNSTQYLGLLITLPPQQSQIISETSFSLFRMSTRLLIFCIKMRQHLTHAISLSIIQFSLLKEEKTSFLKKQDFFAHTFLFFFSQKVLNVNIREVFIREAKDPKANFEARTAQRRLKPQNTLWMYNLSSCCKLMSLIGNPPASC